MSNTYAIPISVKGIVIEDGYVWLRKNERNEWEIPGGKLDKGEQPEQTVVRELREELGFETTVIGLIKAYLYIIMTSQDESHGVMVIIYNCKLVKKVGNFEIIGEAGNSEYAKFSDEEIKDLNMPDFYKVAINKVLKAN